MMVDKGSLFMLRCAAGEWLSEHPEDANAESVRRALIATNHAVDVSPGRSDEQMPDKAKEARARLASAVQAIDRLDMLKDLEQGLDGTVAGETIYEGKPVIDLVREDIAKAEGTK